MIESIPIVKVYPEAHCSQMLLTLQATQLATLQTFI